jgi:putative tryptophan/tyrosine transport system substrate-binding protein
MRYLGRQSSPPQRTHVHGPEGTPAINAKTSLTAAIAITAALTGAAQAAPADDALDATVQQYRSAQARAEWHNALMPAATGGFAAADISGDRNARGLANRGEVDMRSVAQYLPGPGSDEPDSGHSRRWKATMNIKNGAAALGVLAVSLALLTGIGDASAADGPAKVARVGYLSIRAPSGPPFLLIAQELRKLGYVEGKNLHMEYRHANGNADRMPEAAAELVKLDVDVIFALSNVAAFPAQRATRTIPIVVWGAHGALDTGLVTSLRRPGGNLTGVESLAPEVDAKRVELLKEVVPGLAQIAVVYDAGDQGSPLHLSSTQAAGRSMGVAIAPLEVRGPEDFGPVFATAAGKPLGGVLTFTSGLTFQNWQRIMDFSLATRLPSVCEFKELAQAGCMISYGPNFIEFAQRNAAQIDKILKGTPAGELPVEQMTRFELIVNLKTAKALGITIPQSVLLRADEVIR